MNAKSIHVNYKVRFVGFYYSKSKLTNGVVTNMVQHSSAERGEKARLKLCTDGLYIVKPTMFMFKARDPKHIPLKEIATLGRHESNPLNLLCVVDHPTKRYTKILMFRCRREREAAEYVRMFLEIRKLLQLTEPLIDLNGSDDFKNDDVFASTYRDDVTKRVEIDETRTGSAVGMVNGRRELEFSGVTDDGYQETGLQNETKTVSSEKSKENTPYDPVYAMVAKKTRANNQDEVNVKNLQAQKQTVENRGDSEESQGKQQTNEHTTEELHKEIQELKSLLRQSLQMNESLSSTSQVDGFSARPYDVDSANVGHARRVVSNVSPSTDGPFAYTMESLSRGNWGNSTRNYDSSSIADFRLTNDDRIPNSGGIPGEARIKVSNFYSYYGGGGSATDVHQTLPMQRKQKLRLSTRSEDSRPRFSGYQSSTLPAKRSGYRDDVHDGRLRYMSMGNLNQVRLVNAAPLSPRSKANFVIKSPHSGRSHVNPVMLAKPSERLYTAGYPPRNVVFMNNPRVLTQIPENIGTIGNQPIYVMQPNGRTLRCDRPYFNL